MLQTLSSHAVLSRQINLRADLGCFAEHPSLAPRCSSRKQHLCRMDVPLSDLTPPERPTTMPADFVRLETEQERRQTEPTIAISGFGWQHYVENPLKLAELWGVAAYFGRPEPMFRYSHGTRIVSPSFIRPASPRPGTARSTRSRPGTPPRIRTGTAWVRLRLVAASCRPRGGFRRMGFSSQSHCACGLAAIACRRRQPSRFRRVSRSGCPIRRGAHGVQAYAGWAPSGSLLGRADSRERP